MFIGSWLLIMIVASGASVGTVDTLLVDTREQCEYIGDLVKAQDKSVYVSYTCQRSFPPRN